MIVVSDTSPINYLVLIKSIDLLRRMYGEVVLPPAVWAELHTDKTPSAVREWMAARPEWISVAALASEPDARLNYLGPGEREAITLAQQLGGSPADGRSGRTRSSR